MATSSAMSTDNQYIKYTITVTQNSQSVSGNTSNVTVSVRFYRTNTGYTTYGTGTVYCKINGTKYSASVTPSHKITNSGIVLFTKTLNIAHASDGTKTLTCSAWIDHERVDSSEQSYSQKLTTIPRKSTLSVGNGTLNTSQTLTVTRQSTSFTHSIKAKCGSSTLYIKADGTTSTSEVKHNDCSIPFTPPLTWASQNTTGTSVSVTYTITTYSGSTNVGSNSYTKTCSIPATVKPSVSSLTIAEANSAVISAGTAGYIQNQSKLKITIGVTTSYGSAIASYKTTIDGRTYTASSFTSNTLTTSGALTITTTVTDKRGRTGTYSEKIIVQQYSDPTIKTFKVHRCNDDGTENIQGEFCKVSFEFLASGLVNTLGTDINNAKFLIEYKKTSEALYVSNGTIDYGVISGTSGVVSDFATYPALKFPAESGSTYHVKITAQDILVSDLTKVTVLSTAFSIIHFLANGFGMALGKIAELTNVLDIGFQTRFMGGILQPILEPDSDLNSEELRVPNTYTLKSVQSSGYHCGGEELPLKSGTGLFKIETFGEEGQTRQIIEVCHKTNPLRYERFYYGGSWGDWLCTSDYDGTLLWSGGYYMTSGHTANLAEPVSKQRSGIVLVFSEYIDGAQSNTAFHTRFIPKMVVSMHAGVGHCFQFSSSNLTYFSTKYLYVSDTKIVGHDNNTLVATGASGISYDNNRFVLRYVIGV